MCVNDSSEAVMASFDEGAGGNAGNSPRGTKNGGFPLEFCRQDDIDGVRSCGPMTG